jgi:hypothetical protein
MDRIEQIIKKDIKVCKNRVSEFHKNISTKSSKLPLFSLGRYPSFLVN